MKLTKPLLLLSAILCITPTATGTIVNSTRKADLKSVFFLSTLVNFK